MFALETARHEKEKTYRIFCMGLGGLVWAIIFYTIILLFKSFSVYFFSFILVVLFILAFQLWIGELIARSVILSQGVRVSQKQFPECHQLCVQVAADLGLDQLPHVFILQGDGIMNAFAMRFISTRNMVVLNGEIVDQMISRNSYAELRFVIGHEFAHIALGHIDYLENLLMMPAWVIPFVKLALSRGREFSADRAALLVTGEINAAARALIGVAHGSQCLADKVDPNAFIMQDQDVPGIIGWLVRISMPHPVMTRRIIELARFSEQNATILKAREKIVDPRLAHLIVGNILTRGEGGRGVEIMPETQMPGGRMPKFEPQSMQSGPVPMLVGIAGYHAGHLFPIKGKPAVIGRDPATANVVFPMDMTGISRTHCSISYDPMNGTFLLDDRSSHGTFTMNGQRILVGQPVRLKPKERFYLGDPSEVFEADLR